LAPLGRRLKTPPPPHCTRLKGGGSGAPEDHWMLFKEEVRHYCRYERCRSRLKEPVAFEKAFCSKGCVRSFYRFHCVVCQQRMERPTETRRTCGRRLCRQRLDPRSRLPWMEWIMGVLAPASQKPLSALGNPINTGVETGDSADRRGPEWARRVNACRIIAPRRVLERELPARREVPDGSTTGVVGPA
jgi:hypothetical protein